MEYFITFMIGFTSVIIGYVLGYKDGATYRKEVQSELTQNYPEDNAIDEHKCRLALSLYAYFDKKEISRECLSECLFNLDLSMNDVRYVLNKRYGKLGK